MKKQAGFHYEYLKNSPTWLGLPRLFKKIITKIQKFATTVCNPDKVAITWYSVREVFLVQYILNPWRKFGSPSIKGCLRSNSRTRCEAVGKTQWCHLPFLCTRTFRSYMGIANPFPRFTTHGVEGDHSHHTLAVMCY